jgi:hypothetical protein
VSSANIMGFDKVSTVGERSFTYIMKSKSSRTDAWGTLCFTALQFEKNSECY